MPDTDPLIGQQIDHYLIQSHIARGGMADVYLAEDVNLKRPVALKIMLTMLAADKNYAERFRREARTVARLDHPNIVQVFSTGLTPSDQPYIAMQYIDGGSLRDKLQILADRGKLLTTVQALNIARQVTLALGVAHRQNIVHRDLKPGNVLIRPDGKPVLVDLGIAAVGSAATRLTQTGNIIGTPDYMSPEQVSGKPLDGRSDLYSLGIILYEMLGGQRPFHAKESIAILYKQVNEQPPPLDSLRPDISAATRDLVHTLLQKDPNQRHQQAADLVAAIDGALLTEGVAGPSSGATQVLTNLPAADLLSRQQMLQSPPPTPVAASAPTPSVSGAPSAAPATPAPEPTRRPTVPLWVLITLAILVVGVGLLLLLDDGPTLTTATAEPTGVATGVATDVATSGATAAPVSLAATSTLEATTTPAPLPSFTPQPTETAVPPSPTATPGFAASYIAAADGMEMRLVPAGPFTMGSTEAQIEMAIANCLQNPEGDSCAVSEFIGELPQRTVTLSAFYLDATEVTNAQYKACVSAGGCSLPAAGDGRYRRSAYYDQAQFASYPVVWVSWSDAEAYCRWAGRRLPTEAEWEKAARGEDGRIYPWGNTFDDARTNTQDNGTEALQPVAQYNTGSGPYGHYDLAGGVWEYVADWYDPDYYSVAPNTDPPGPASSPVNLRVLRSGSFANYQHYARAANRGAVPPGTRTQFRGIRCAISAESAP